MAASIISTWIRGFEANPAHHSRVIVGLKAEPHFVPLNGKSGKLVTSSAKSFTEVVKKIRMCIFLPFLVIVFKTQLKETFKQFSGKKPNPPPFKNLVINFFFLLFSTFEVSLIFWVEIRHLLM